MTFRIYYSNDRAIRRRIFALERKASFLTSTPENQLANTGARGINRDQRLSLRLQILVEGLNDEQFAVLKRIVLHRRDHCSDNARELHSIFPEP